MQRESTQNLVKNEIREEHEVQPRDGEDHEGGME